jgi:histidinol-phosphate phosphatase family protein
MGHSPPTNIAVFVDRDGTLNEDHGYVTSPEQLVVFPAVPKALARLNHLGFRVILLTNQSAIGRGFMTVQDLQRIHQKLEDLLRAQDGKIDAVYYCPHHPDEGCACRKPNIAMIQEAAEHFSLDLSLCYVVGDKWSDLEVAHRAGVQGVLVMSSDYSAVAVRARDAGQFPIAHVAESFVQAVDWIEEDLWQRHQHAARG